MWRRVRRSGVTSLRRVGFQRSHSQRNIITRPSSHYSARRGCALPVQSSDQERTHEILGSRVPAPSRAASAPDHSLFTGPAGAGAAHPRSIVGECVARNRSPCRLPCSSCERPPTPAPPPAARPLMACARRGLVLPLRRGAWPGPAGRGTRRQPCSGATRAAAAAAASAASMTTACTWWVGRGCPGGRSQNPGLGTGCACTKQQRSSQLGMACTHPEAPHCRHLPGATAHAAGPPHPPCRVLACWA